MNPEINRTRLFLASRIALIATAMTFAIRASLMDSLGTAFNITPFHMGIVAGTAFWGFTLSMIVGGALCDLVGMKRLLAIAIAGHITGIVLTLTAQGFWSLFISTLFIGIANGMVEAACNPLVSSLYPDQKTTKLNQFHVWFPGGIVIGGLVAFILDYYGFSWKVQVSTILIPTLIYGILFFNEKFPETERVSSGYTTRDMINACVKPLFIFMVVCMLFTSATELGTTQWIKVLLASAGADALLFLIFINGLMALGRAFAHEVVHKLSPLGMLLSSSVCSALGLFLLSQSSGYAAFGAAALFAIGICYFWPTMLGFVSENMPKTGALGMSVMGAAGMLSVSIVVPLIAIVYEHKTQAHLPSGKTMDMYKNAAAESTDGLILKTAQVLAGSETLLYVAILPTLLVLAFGSLYILRRKISKY